MVQFNKLKLTGFKSFVENTELEIKPGLTGIIGPNGCGKSNLVEALRWVMGENSAKRMRSTGMNDVIFAGTDNRPQRNTAEVTLTVDNADHTAPAELNDDELLEISRKIERDVGSVYKVNGKGVRMKDIQLLFADSSIGANSPAMVSQGRVADMINAKPKQRRLVLEEAAGISGLHARRHEAELKLNGAEANLTRLEDVMGGMEAQLENLKKQARQASRYRNISGHIEQTESSVLYLKWLSHTSAVDAAIQAFKDAETIVADKMSSVTVLSTQLTEATADLPDLRKAEAEAAASLQRLKLAYGSLESEERQVMEERTKSEELLRQFTSDVEHEKNQKIEANETIEKLSAEYKRHEGNNSNQSELEESAKADVTSVQETVAKFEEELSALTQSVATAEADYRAQERNVGNLRNRKEQLVVRKERFDAEYKSLIEDTPGKAKLDEVAEEVETAERTFNDTSRALEDAEEDKSKYEVKLQEAREHMNNTRSSYKELNAEAEALRRILKNQQSDEFEPIIESLQVEAGVEKALAVALGEDLQASLNNSSPIYWQTLAALDNAPALPAPAKALSEFVKGPEALNRSLSQIGVVDDEATAHSIMSQLAVGQCLVTLNGGAWRWDGLVVTPNAENSSAIRLEQKNRLADLEKDIEKMLAKLEEADAKFNEASETYTASKEALETLRKQSREASETLNDLRRKHAKLSSRLAEVNAKIAGLETSIANASQEIEEVSAEFAEAEEAFTNAPDISADKARIDTLRAKLKEERDSLAEEQAKYAEIRRAGESRIRRMESIQVEIDNWNKRLERIYARVLELEERITQAQDVIAQLDNRPAEIEAEKQSLMTSIADAEKKRSDASDKLISSETHVNNLQRDLHEAETILSDTREARAVAQASVSNAQTSQKYVEEQIFEKFSATPEEVAKKFEIDTEKLDSVDRLQDKLERLVKERDNMGPVNLRAEIESQEISEKMQEMDAEKADLIQAIDKLREGINKLNKEARQRLLDSFETVDKNFQELFHMLFGGGSAYMKLVDDADPLEAGLEIFAQPPGKKNQSLSLLSGGEQALTSIALIFAMFLTNPAPICVLDEVDAPLDESNVDRYCSMLEHIAANSTTRFLVITHHRMTMARMDRLYGVTMGEKGVSQLVSVDFQQHELDLIEEAA